jgi:hypothetical protein
MHRTFALVGLSLTWGLVAAAEPSASAKIVTVSLDGDLISFFKTAIWVGGIFLALYALIGVVFFGWDVAKARASLSGAQKEVREQLRELRKDFREMKELKDKLQELGAKLQEETEPLAEKAGPVSATAPSPAPGTASRTDRDLIREVIASSSYEWTTIGRVLKKTGLSREDILREARSDPDIVVGYGRQTKDHLFKFKHAG